MTPPQSKRIKAMARFYAETYWKGTRGLDGWLDAFKDRWPDATQQERLLAHRLAEALVAN